MGLAEREEAFATLMAQLADVVAGTGRAAVVVTGAVASGKTALLHAFAEQAIESAGALFLNATASRAERGLALGVVGQLFRSIELPEAEAERVTRLLAGGALSVALHDQPAEVADEMTLPVLHGLWKVLRTLVERRPVVIGIDDLQYVDPPSLQFILYLVRRLRSVPVLLVLNDCIRPRQAHPLFMAELCGQPYYRPIRLEQLSTAGVQAVLAGHFDPPTAARLAPEFWAHTGGNPALVHALIADLRSAAARGSGAGDGGSGAGDRCPAAGPIAGHAFEQAVSRCLYRCEASMMSIARAVAVIDEPAPPVLLGEVVGLDMDSASRAVVALDAVGLLEDGRFRHDAIRTAVLDGLPPGGRADLHRRVAQALHDNGAPSREVATHLVLGGPTGEPWMVTVLQEAAARELTDGDVQLAVRYLRLARQTCVDERQRAAITSALAGAEWQLDPAAVVRLLPELLDALRHGRLTGRDPGRLVTYLLWHGWTTQAVDMAHWLQPANGPSALVTPDARDSLVLLSWLFPGLVQHVAAALPGTPTRTSSLVATIIDGADFGDDLMITAEQVVLSARLDDTALTPFLAALGALVYIDALDRAASWCDTLLKAAENRGAITWNALFLAVRALIDVRCGELAEAEKHALAALTLIPPKSWGVAVGIPLHCILLARTAMGRYDETVEALQQAVPEQMFHTLGGLFYLEARGRYHLAIGHPHTALADFHSCGRLMLEWGLDQPAMLPWRTDAAAACLALDRPEQALQLLTEQFELLAPNDNRARGGALRVLARLAEPADRLGLLRDALHALESVGDLTEQAQVQADLAGAYKALGQPDEARQAAVRARQLADRTGTVLPRPAPPLPAGAPGPRWGSGSGADTGAGGRLGVGSVPGTDGGAAAPAPAQPTAAPAMEPAAPATVELSAAEQRVAALAADGFTNQQIANRLHITVSTVEQHLTRVYRKLTVNRRMDLAEALGRHRPG